MVFAWFAHTVSYVTPAGGKEGGKNEKHTLCKTCFFRGLPIRASMSPLWKARKEEKTKKPHFAKVCPYGPLCHPSGRQGRRKKRKNHILQNVVFSWFSMSPLWEATTLCKTWFLRSLPIRASMSPLWKARKEEKTKKPYCKTCFFRGLPIRASMSPLWKARNEEKTKKPHFAKRVFFVVCPYGPLCHPCERQGRRKKRKNHVLQNVVFSWFAHTGLYVTPLGGKEGGKNEKNTFCQTWFFHGLIFLHPIFRVPFEEAGLKSSRARHWEIW